MKLMFGLYATGAKIVTLYKIVVQTLAKVLVSSVASMQELLVSYVTDLG